MKKDTGGTGKAQGGYSLIEVLVSIVILLIITNIIASYAVFGQKSANQSQLLFTANQLASTGLERAKNKLKNPDSLAVINPDTTAGWLYEDIVSETVKNTAFELRTRYRMVSKTIQLIEIQATANWEGGSHSYKLNTIHSYK